MDRSSDQTQFVYSWLSSLESTLNDSEGTQSFEAYLTRCNCLPLLEFIWACDGMKRLVEENPDKVEKLVSCIYKNYIVSGTLAVLSNEVLISIVKKVDAYYERPEPSDMPPCRSQHLEGIPLGPKLDLGIYDEAKIEIEGYLRVEVFPRFQKAVQDGKICVGGSSRKSGLANNPEQFARALCEKLEGLKLDREPKT